MARVLLVKAAQGSRSPGKYRPADVWCVGSATPFAFVPSGKSPPASAAGRRPVGWRDRDQRIRSELQLQIHEQRGPLWKEACLDRAHRQRPRVHRTVVSLPRTDRHAACLRSSKNRRHRRDLRSVPLDEHERRTAAAAHNPLANGGCGGKGKHGLDAEGLNHNRSQQHGYQRRSLDKHSRRGPAFGVEPDSNLVPRKQPR